MWCSNKINGNGFSWLGVLRFLFKVYKRCKVVKNFVKGYIKVEINYVIESWLFMLEDYFLGCLRGRGVGY